MVTAPPCLQSARDVDVGDRRRNQQIARPAVHMSHPSSTIPMTGYFLTPHPPELLFFLDPSQ